MARPRKESQSVVQPPQPTPSALLDVEEAAKWFGISRTKLFELMHEQDFPVIVLSEKLLRFDPNSLYQWVLKRQKTGRWIA